MTYQPRMPGRFRKRHVLEREARVADLLLELRLLVAAEVVQVLVERAVEPRERRHDQDEPAARPQHVRAGRRASRRRPRCARARSGRRRCRRRAPASSRALGRARAESGRTRRARDGSSRNAPSQVLERDGVEVRGDDELAAGVRWRVMLPNPAPISSTRCAEGGARSGRRASGCTARACPCARASRGRRSSDPRPRGPSGG